MLTLAEFYAIKLTEVELVLVAFGDPLMIFFTHHSYKKQGVV